MARADHEARHHPRPDLCDPRRHSGPAAYRLFHGARRPVAGGSRQGAPAFPHALRHHAGHRQRRDDPRRTVADRPGRRIGQHRHFIRVRHRLRRRAGAAHRGTGRAADVPHAGGVCGGAARRGVGLAADARAAARHLAALRAVASDRACGLLALRRAPQPGAKQVLSEARVARIWSAAQTNVPVTAGHDRSGSGVVAGRMNSIFVTHGTADAVPIWFVTAATYADVRAGLDADARAFADAAGFEPKAGRHLLLPGKNGLGGVLFGIEANGDVKDLFLPGRLPQLLPDGVYRFANEPHDARLAALAVALGSYRFTRYRKSEGRQVKLELPQSLDRDELSHMAEAVTLARDLINTPANDMGPADLEAAARKLAASHNAEIRAIVGDDLLAQNFTLIHAVGRAAAASAAPRLIDMVWGDDKHPRVTLVGKGVCFDTGGLDIKPESGMLNMKKDMGGAATALALAHMIMARGLKVRLRVLIPAVENSIAGASFRPRDIYTSRKGITVEIGNTDAEGRLILADALALADEEKPELIADFATLTGAARVALGPDVPAFFTDDDALAGELMGCAASENDPLWRLPLWRPYEAMLESKVADINNVGGSQGGAITAALFMRRFVDAKSWLHFDLFAWSAAAKPGRPEGGDCQTARALYALLSDRYG